jgi:phosphoenolpyruvate carboxylase
LKQVSKLSAFHKHVHTRYHIYNGLFLNLSYTDENNVGYLLPILKRSAEKGLSQGLDPERIINDFFDEHFDNSDPKARLNFMFRVIQFIERQVVLYDSIEDSAFPHMKKHREELTVLDFLQIAKREEKTQEVIDKLNDFSVRITFTAHPTQFYPMSVLDIIADLRKLIEGDEIHAIDSKLHQLGLTSMLNKDKPTPLDEAKNIIHYLRSVYYDAIGQLYAELRQDIGSELFDNPKIVQLGFWPGGDRDGNPFVTHQITRQVADELRMTLMKCYYGDVKTLSRLLSFKHVNQILEDLRKKLYDAMFNPGIRLSYAEIMDSLQKVRSQLVENYHSMFIDELEVFMDKVQIFRTHFACMDIRQNHDVHERAITEILRFNGLISDKLDEIDEERLIQILSEESLNLGGFNSEDSLVNDCIKNISQLKEIQDINGMAACERYIISNSEDIFSILFVFALLRWAGEWNEGMDIDIIPLFETMNGMKHSEAIMQQVFDVPAYQKHLAHRNQTQTMMLGFSDGTKDGGYLQANWNIFKTKEALSTVCKANNVRAIFFDGRGGPPARGGGKTHRFYAAQSDKISNNEIQITIQGQTITSTYGTQDQFKYNADQMLAAGLHNEISGDQNSISEEHRSCLEELATLSFDKYKALKEHPSFIPYLELQSTLKYYARANIGSRPAKRGGDKQLRLEDLRAISFVGSWSQLKQNVPGYYGIGTALNQMNSEGRLEEFKALFREVPIFRALILNSMMSLAKTNFDLTSYMSKDKDFGPFWNLLHAEFELTVKMVLEISGYEQLMEEEALSRESVMARESIVLPLLVIQQYGLMQIKKNDSLKESYEKLVTRSLYGNINASRNSA